VLRDKEKFPTTFCATTTRITDGVKVKVSNVLVSSIADHLRYGSVGQHLGGFFKNACPQATSVKLNFALFAGIFCCQFFGEISSLIVDFRILPGLLLQSSLYDVHVSDGIAFIIAVVVVVAALERRDDVDEEFAVDQEKPDLSVLALQTVVRQWYFLLVAIVGNMVYLDSVLDHKVHAPVRG